MKVYAEMADEMSQARRMPKSSLHLADGTLITPFTFVLLKTWDSVQRSHRFVEYIPKKSLSTFVQSLVIARCEGDEEPPKLKYCKVLDDSLSVTSTSSVFRAVQHLWSFMTKPRKN